MNMDLSSIFAEYAGREIDMVEHQRTINVGGQEMTFSEWDLADPNDPTIAEMRETAAENGLTLRMWWTGVAGTMDFRTDRVNAHIEPDSQGVWRVCNDFSIG